uniref:Uncharacterized protein n=1 Tax=Bracon brevicornis TaxID=1563983 RepID=A0A6V7KEG8_9HYME
MGISPRMTKNAHIATSSSASPNAAIGGSETRWSTFGQLCNKNQPAINPTNMDLRMALNSSANTCEENMRFKPLIGFSLVRSNLMELGLNSTPPSNIGAEIATSTAPTIKGTNAETPCISNDPKWRNSNLSSLTNPGSK